MNKKAEGIYWFRFEIPTTFELISDAQSVFLWTKNQLFFLPWMKSCDHDMEFKMRWFSFKNIFSLFDRIALKCIYLFYGFKENVLIGQFVFWRRKLDVKTTSELKLWASVEIFHVFFYASLFVDNMLFSALEYNCIIIMEKFFERFLKYNFPISWRSIAFQ